MADDIDRAQEHEQKNTEILRQVRKKEGPAPTGYCLNCGELLSDNMRWCNADCRDDFCRSKGGL